MGVASTGTAIASLSGAAATNATLAWLGAERWQQEVVELRWAQRYSGAWLRDQPFL
jgi:hypothetical protein